jgi:hypothetical protein
MLALAAWPSEALAGMPGVDLTDVAEMRLQSISFFLVVFLLSGLAIKSLWNWLRRDFPRLPWLSYPKALALVGLWGFVFVLVLTMISGARELMTPGAWEKEGYTYRLSEDGRGALEEERLRRIGEIRGALLEYAQQNGGMLPPDEHVPEISAALWETADVSRMRFVYVGGDAGAAPGAIILHEPPILPPPYLALTRDGRIERLSPEDLERLAGGDGLEDRP